ncbi:MAG TPA: nuclear transport factor 2 family protein [Pyrinomonadaceae bacterium]|nr:nuclear transport factor 2 family protein [Pyrinomonadaceae bacterium]
MLSEEERQNLELAKRYIELVSNPSTEPEDLKAVFDENIVWREMPNLFAPSGRVSDYATALASFGKGREYLPKQTYTLRQAIAGNDTVVLEIGWVGEVAKSIGPFPAGTQLRAQLATFLRFQNGKIVSQTDYLCYDPVASGAA